MFNFISLTSLLLLLLLLLFFSFYFFVVWLLFFFCKAIQSAPFRTKRIENQIGYDSSSTMLAAVVQGNNKTNKNTNTHTHAHKHMAALA